MASVLLMQENAYKKAHVRESLVRMENVRPALSNVKRKSNLVLIPIHWIRLAAILPTKVAARSLARMEHAESELKLALL